VIALAVGANVLAVAANALAVAGVDDERSQLGWQLLTSRASQKNPRVGEATACSGSCLNHGANVAFGADFREEPGSGSVTARPCALHDQ